MSNWRKSLFSTGKIVQILLGALGIAGCIVIGIATLGNNDVNSIGLVGVLILSVTLLTLAVINIPAARTQEISVLNIGPDEVVQAAIANYNDNVARAMRDEILTFISKIKDAEQGEDAEREKQAAIDASVARVKNQLIPLELNRAFHEHLIARLFHSRQ